MSVEEYRIKLEGLKKEVSVATNYFLLSDLVEEYQKLSEQLLREYSNHEFFLRVERENKNNLCITKGD